MAQLSAVILTFNEEHNIGRCIDSVKGIAEDIVVVDSFSTDRTGEICRGKGVRFIQHPFEGYIEQKNWALAQAKYDRCLSLDADEALDEALKQSVIGAMENWEHEAYTMNRLTNYCGKWIRHSGWYPDVKLRLFDRRKGKWEGINPHDEYRMEKGIRSRHLKGNILHYSYYSLSDHIKQVEHFTNVGAKALYDKGKKATCVKLYISPPAKFLRDYFIRMGFLDGFEGFTICRISALATFLKYAKLRHLHRKKHTTKD